MILNALMILVDVNLIYASIALYIWMIPLIVDRNNGFVASTKVLIMVVYEMPAFGFKIHLKDKANK